MIPSRIIIFRLKFFQKSIHFVFPYKVSFVNIPPLIIIMPFPNIPWNFLNSLLIVKISQTAYIKDLLKKFNMEGSNTKHVPIRPETLLMHADMYDQFQEVGTNKVTNPLWNKENVDCHYPVRECVGGLLHVTRWPIRLPNSHKQKKDIFRER